MHIDESTRPASPPRLANAQSAPQNLLLGRTLDKTVESQRRRLLAVAIPKSLSHDDIARADEALEQFSLAFFSAPNDSLANAFGSALRAVHRPGKAALIDGTAKRFDGGFVAAALDGQRLVVSAVEPGLIIVQQGEQRFSFPRTKAAGDEFLDPTAAIFETRLDPGDIVALLSGGKLDDRNASERLTRTEVTEIAGPDGAWVWIELEKAPNHDLRHRAGLLSEPEPGIRGISSATAKPADPLWVRGGPADGAMFQKPPAIDSLRRYRNASTSASLSRSARTRLPRGRPSALMVGAVLLALLLVGSGFGYLYANRPPAATLPDPEIPKHTAALAAALAGNEPAAIEAVLPAAERALAIGQKTNLPKDELAVLQGEILQAHDALDGVLRMSNVTMLGRLPDNLAERNPTLAESAGVLYLLAPGPYQIDLDRLTMLGLPFAPNSPIHDFDAQVAASNAGGVLASDGSRIVLLDFEGNATEIGVTVWPKGVDATTSLIASFQQRLYLFDQESGEIWVADGQDNEAYRWLSDTQAPLQTGAIGMTIDGAIHVVYPDGRIVNLSSGEVYGRSKIGASGDDIEILLVDAGDETGNLYLAVMESERATLDVLDLATEQTREILLPPTTLDGQTIEDIFMDATSLVVSEVRGQVFWISNGALWTATLPEIPSAE